MDERKIIRSNWTEKAKFDSLKTIKQDENKPFGGRKMIYKKVNELIGNTPLLQLEQFSESVGAKVIAKLEMFNPAGSVKDRVGKYLIAAAEDEGRLSPGATIIEPTSGNTGVGLAAVAASLGYKVILTMPETMSVERRNLLKAYGAKIVLTEGSKGMTGAIEKAEELAKEIPGAFIPGQFDNDANPGAHRETTGPEIWADTDGKVDIFVSAIGTGGTITGVGEYLKGKNPDIRIIGVEPAASPVLSGGEAGPHKIQGIGAGFVPKVLNVDICDEIIRVTDEEAFRMGNALAKAEGILCGISSGAALFAACRVAKREENRGKNIVVILPDTGERYLSTGLFGE
jgi:cysteine synthase A